VAAPEGLSVDGDVLAAVAAAEALTADVAGRLVGVALAPDDGRAR
jgi:hypothetical protein